MDQIPVEIFNLIIQYIPEVKQLGHLVRICKRMQHIIDKSKIWEYICQHHIFSAKIIEMSKTNNISWKINLKLINTTVVKSYNAKIRRRKGTNSREIKTIIIELFGNGTCYTNINLKNIKKPNYQYKNGTGQISMYNVDNLNSGFKNRFIIDFTFDHLCLSITTSSNKRLSHTFIN